MSPTTEKLLEWKKQQTQVKCKTLYISQILINIKILITKQAHLNEQQLLISWQQLQITQLRIPGFREVHRRIHARSCINTLAQGETAVQPSLELPLHLTAAAPAAACSRPS